MDKPRDHKSRWFMFSRGLGIKPVVQRFGIWGLRSVNYYLLTEAVSKLQFWNSNLSKTLFRKP
jgi:hypothetical protein